VLRLCETLASFLASDSCPQLQELEVTASGPTDTLPIIQALQQGTRSYLKILALYGVKTGDVLEYAAVAQLS